MSKRTEGILLAALTGVCWAVLAIALKYALKFFSTGTIVWARLMIAFAILGAYYAFAKPRRAQEILFRPTFPMIMAGLFLAFNYFGYMRGLELTGASNAQIMIQLGPLSLLFFGVWYFREPMRFAQWLGVVLAAFGFGLFYWDQILVAIANANQESNHYVEGCAWIFLGALTWAIFAALQKIQIERRRWTPQDVNLVVYALCSIVLFPLANISEITSQGPWPLFIMFLLGLNTVVAYGAFAEAIGRIPAGHVSLIVSVNPLLTIFLMEIVASLGLDFVSPEPIHWRGYLGAAAVVAGVAIAVSLKARATAKPSA